MAGFGVAHEWTGYPGYMYIGLYEGNGIWTGRVRGLDGMGIHGFCRKRGKVGVFLFFLCVCVCVDWSSRDHIPRDVIWKSNDTLFFY